MKSEEIKMIIKGYLEDEAEVVKKTEISLVAQYLMREFMPQNTQIRGWVRQLYVEDKDGNRLYKLKDVMNSIFSYFATEIDEKILCTGAKLFVDYAADNNELIERNQTYEYNEMESPYFWQHVGYLMERIGLKKCIGTRQGSEVQLDLKKLQYLKQVDEHIDQEGLKTIYVIIKKYWDVLKNTTYTYRLLASMSKLQSWKENSKTRIELIRVLNRFDVIMRED